MGLHLGLHIPVITARLQLTPRQKAVISALFCCLGGVGLFLFLKNGIPSYLFFRVPFAFLDYEKSFWLVFLENALMLSAWVFAGAQIATLCLKRNRQGTKKTALIAGSIAAAAVLSLVLNMAFPGENLSDFDTAGWAAVPEAQEAQSVQTEAPAAAPAQPQNMSPENKEFRIT
jgi:hypothetical protein